MARSITVPRGVGILLLVAAGLKMYGLAAEPIAATGIFAVPEFQAALVNGEILLGLWLLSGAQPAAAWCVCIATFGCFACASFYLGWIGQASCGCFGTLHVSPWYAFALDLIVLAACAYSRPELAELTAGPRAIAAAPHKPLIVVSGVATFLVAVALIGSAAFGSPQAALAYLRGETVSIAPRVIDLGQLPGGRDHRVTVQLTNRGDEAVKIFGGTVDCTCDITDDLPLTIAPGDTKRITVIVQLPRAPGFFTRKALLRTDCPGASALVVQVVGRIVEP